MRTQSKMCDPKVCKQAKGSSLYCILVCDGVPKDEMIIPVPPRIRPEDQFKFKNNQI